MDMLFFTFQHTMFYMIPLMLVALGGMFSERSGVVNIALDGKMIVGALTGILFISEFQGQEHGVMDQGILLLGLLVAMGTGMLIALLHAFASINLKANQIISGIAINMFAPAFAVYIARFLRGTQHVFFINQFRIESVPVLGNIPVIGPMFFQNTFITTYIGFVILAVSAFVLYKTKFGLRLRACGEHPQAADSVGINVAGIRYAGVLISGALAGIGGVIVIIPVSVAFSGTVSGYGFLALAVLIFGAWKPKRILFAAFFFGIMQTMSVSHFVQQALNIPSHFLSMIPYIATLVVLAVTSKKTVAPLAVGKPYDKSH